MREYPKRAILGASLITQSFLHNAIFFPYTLVLSKFSGVDPKAAPLFLIAFAIGNLTGPLTIGHLFDTIGRKMMIAGTSIVSGLLPGVSAFLFEAGVLDAVTRTIAWMVILSFASAGAGARRCRLARPRTRFVAGWRPCRVGRDGWSCGRH